MKVEFVSQVAELNKKITFQKIVVADDSNPDQIGDGTMEVDEKPEQLLLTAEIIIREMALKDLKVVNLATNEEIKIRLEQVIEPNPVAVIKAEIQLTNKFLFEAIQDIQSQNSGRTTKQLYDYIKLLDSQLDEVTAQVFKMKNKTAKKELFEELKECKDKTTEAIEVLRNHKDGYGIQNAQIAKLNDLAYKAIRKQNFSKKLDERAIKNQELYDKLEKQMQEILSKIDFAALRIKHQSLIDQIGSCPLSCNDIIDAMQSGDCMCVALDIGRPETAIVDPSKLVIKKVIPTFMCGDSFLDSALFNMGKDGDSHGGFQISAGGKLAMGLGRENINGVLPLHLFKEHWNIARRKAGPLFGFMCTLDIMGYVQSQYFTVPFLVLLKAISQSVEDKSDIMGKITEMVEATCVNILSFHEDFRKNVVVQIKEFYNNEEKRTIEVVPSVQLMLVQMHCLMKMNNAQEEFGDDFKLDQDKVKLIFRFAVEELLRRQ